jgi:hypothetical protein
MMPDETVPLEDFPSIALEPISFPVDCLDGSQNQSLQPRRRHQLCPAQRAAIESRGEGAEEKVMFWKRKLKVKAIVLAETMIAEFVEKPLYRVPQEMLITFEVITVPRLLVRRHKPTPFRDRKFLRVEDPALGIERDFIWHFSSVFHLCSIYR